MAGFAAGSVDEEFMALLDKLHVLDLGPKIVEVVGANSLDEYLDVVEDPADVLKELEEAKIKLNMKQKKAIRVITKQLVADFRAENKNKEDAAEEAAAAVAAAEEERKAAALYTGVAARFTANSSSGSIFQCGLFLRPGGGGDFVRTKNKKPYNQSETKFRANSSDCWHVAGTWQAEGSKVTFTAGKKMTKPQVPCKILIDLENNSIPDLTFLKKTSKWTCTDVHALPARVLTTTAKSSSGNPFDPLHLFIMKPEGEAHYWHVLRLLKSRDYCTEFGTWKEVADGGTELHGEKLSGVVPKDVTESFVLNHSGGNTFTCRLKQ